MAAAIQDSHAQSEAVFERLRTDKETERQEKEKQMASLMEQMLQLDQNLNKLFSKSITVKKVPLHPLSSVIEELRLKIRVYNGEPNEGSDVPIPPPLPDYLKIEESVVKPTPPNSPQVKTPGNESSNKMIDELKNAFHHAIQPDGEEEIIQIKPSFVSSFSIQSALLEDGQ